MLYCLPILHQHRCVNIFNDKKTNTPTGFALGSIEGRVAIQYVQPTNPKDNFTFKCHRSSVPTSGGVQDIYAVSREWREIFVQKQLFVWFTWIVEMSKVHSLCVHYKG